MRKEPPCRKHSLPLKTWLKPPTRLPKLGANRPSSMSKLALVLVPTPRSNAIWTRGSSRRAAQPSAAVSMPPEIEARAQEALRTLWTAASGLAQQETQSVKEQAHAEVTQARQELSEALGEITRLEQAEADLTRRLDEERAKAHELELANASLKTQAERATRLETELETLRREAFGASDLRIALAELQKQVTALAGASQPTLLQAESKGKATRKQSSS